MAVENRKLLRRAVRYLVAEAGITQFLDIGTSLPTQGNVHQVAQGINPTARGCTSTTTPWFWLAPALSKPGGTPS